LRPRANHLVGITLPPDPALRSLTRHKWSIYVFIYSVKRTSLVACNRLSRRRFVISSRVPKTFPVGPRNESAHR
jgi:hypothetical protein